MEALRPEEGSAFEEELADEKVEDEDPAVRGGSSITMMSFGFGGVMEKAGGWDEEVLGRRRRKRDCGLTVGGCWAG